MSDITLKLLKEWDKHLDDYDPYAPGGISQYGSGAIGIEVEGVKSKVKEIIAEAESQKREDKSK